MNKPILTYADGRPIERPTPPGPNATSEERTAFIRALNAYHDAVADCANRAFADRLREVL